MHCWATRRRGSVGRLVPPRRHDVGYPYPPPNRSGWAFRRVWVSNNIISSIILDIIVDRVLGRDARRSCGLHANVVNTRCTKLNIFLLRFYHVAATHNADPVYTAAGTFVHAPEITQNEKVTSQFIDVLGDYFQMYFYKSPL